MQQCSLVASSCLFVQMRWTHVSDGRRLALVRGERSLGDARPLRRGAARPADVGHLLLPVRAHRSLGAGPAPRASVDVVPRRERRAVLARGRRRRAPAVAPRRLRAGAPRRGSPTAQRARRSGATGRRAGVRLRQRPLRDPAPRRRWGAARAWCAARSASGTRPPATWSAAAPNDRHRRHAGVAVARGRVDAQHPAAHRRRGAGAAPGRRGRDHPALRHPRHPGHPDVDRRATRTDRPGGWAPCRIPASGGPCRSCTAIRPGRGRWHRSRRRPRCRARRSPPGSPSSWASQ